MRISHQRGPLDYIVWVGIKACQLYKWLTDPNYNPDDWNGLPPGPPREDRRAG